MQSSDFDLILKAQLAITTRTLSSKAKEYASDEDRLQNFKSAATLQGINQVQALGGMMAKHTVSIFDMIADDDYLSYEHWIAWQEKITDHINYLILLRATVIDEMDKNTNAARETPKEN